MEEWLKQNPKLPMVKFDSNPNEIVTIGPHEWSVQWDNPEGGVEVTVRQPMTSILPSRLDWEFPLPHHMYQRGYVDGAITSFLFP